MDRMRHGRPILKKKLIPMDSAYQYLSISRVYRQASRAVIRRGTMREKSTCIFSRMLDGFMTACVKDCFDSSIAERKGHPTILRTAFRLGHVHDRKSCPGIGRNSGNRELGSRLH